MEVYTTGFTKKSAEQFFESIRLVGIRRLLGSVDISPQPDECTDKLDEAEIGAIQFVEA
jgi:hypothetical protein